MDPKAQVLFFLRSFGRGLRLFIKDTARGTERPQNHSLKGFTKCGSIKWCTTSSVKCGGGSVVADILAYWWQKNIKAYGIIQWTHIQPSTSEHIEHFMTQQESDTWPKKPESFLFTVKMLLILNLTWQIGRNSRFMSDVCSNYINVCVYLIILGMVKGFILGRKMVETQGELYYTY